jgi:hypothetical protein
VDVTDRSGRNPGKDVFDLVVWERRMLGSSQDGEYVRGRSPTLLMPDEGEIDFATPLPLVAAQKLGGATCASYTGN